MKSLNVLAVLFLVVIVGCSSSDTERPPEEPGSLTSFNTVNIPSGLPNAARAYVFDYVMVSVRGTNTTARAQLFEPIAAAPSDGYALVVWAHGTTGIANACAPSSSFDNFGNSTAIDALLEAGYAVLAPDYEGFGTPQIHPYYIRTSHANAIWDSIPAAHQVEGSNLSDNWSIIGHSQGGHVALATARAVGYSAYPLQATVALAPGTDLVSVSDAAFDAMDVAISSGELQASAERLYYLNVYGTFIAHAFNVIDPNFEPESMFGDSIAPLMDEALNESNCGDFATSVANTVSQYAVANNTVAGFAGINRNWHTIPSLAEHIANEAMSDEGQDSPLLIVQGDLDRQIPISATTAFVEAQQALGTDITYEIIAGANHFAVGRSDFPVALNWLRERFPPN